MTKSGEVKKRSRKIEAVAIALCIPEKKTDSRMYPVLCGTKTEKM